MFAHGRGSEFQLSGEKSTVICMKAFCTLNEKSLRKTKVFAVLGNKNQSVSRKPKFKDLEYLSLG